jgi:hypothetical protein
MRKTILLVLATASLALVTAPASACNVVGYTRSGEPLCARTSDGPGQQYTDGRWRARRAEWERRRENERISVASGGTSWLGNKPYVQCLQFMTSSWNNATEAMKAEGRRQCNRKYYGHD